MTHIRHKCRIIIAHPPSPHTAFDILTPISYLVKNSNQLSREYSD